MKEVGFDTQRYLERQGERIYEAMTGKPNQPSFLEFGGKPFTDHHAARVMPGYDSECKAEILRNTVELAEVVMVVNSLDIFDRPDGRKPKGRIRGDSGLIYDQETIRLIDEAHKKHIPIEKVVLAIMPQQIDDKSADQVAKFDYDLKRIGVKLLTHFSIEGYPNPDIFFRNNDIFGQNDRIRVGNGNLVVISPGGGSGKFGVLLSEMYKALTEGQTPNYVKFETFPIYQLSADHALNLAFEAATADLGNKVIDVRNKPNQGDQYRTSYDKDIENFALLLKMFSIFGKDEELAYMRDSVDMGINRIVDGITDMDVVIKACREEIVRRIARYKGEVDLGMEETKTVLTSQNVLTRFDRIYSIS